MSENSVSQWIINLKQGEHVAAQQVWNRYYTQLLAVARRALGSSTRRVANEEDVVLNAFDSCFRAADEGRFPDLHDRDGLWNLLVTITERKAFNQARDERRAKRGGGKVRGESIFENRREGAVGGLDGFADKQLSPEFGEALYDSIAEILTVLSDEESEVAKLKLEGLTNKEIGQTLGISIATTERRLRRIREKCGVLMGQN